MRLPTRIPWQTRRPLTLTSSPHSLSHPTIPRHHLSTSLPLPPQNTSQPIPKRPSPYRLLETTHFQQTFAPLLAAGWRLDSTVPTRQVSGLGTDELERADLEDRRLLRVYPFHPGRQGYADALSFVAKVGQLIHRIDVSLVHPNPLIPALPRGRP